MERETETGYDPELESKKNIAAEEARPEERIGEMDKFAQKQLEERLAELERGLAGETQLSDLKKSAERLLAAYRLQEDPFNQPQNDPAFARVTEKVRQRLDQHDLNQEMTGVLEALLSELQKRRIDAAESHQKGKLEAAANVERAEEATRLYHAGEAWRKNYEAKKNQSGAAESLEENPENKDSEKAA